MSLRRQTEPVISDREHDHICQRKCVDTSLESGLGSSQGNISLSQVPSPPLKPLRPLRPLYFEVPQSSPPEFVGRQWVMEEILQSARHISLEGGPGSGKTAVILALVQSSCFAAERGGGRAGEREVAEQVVAYHFCQADNAPTCQVAEFVHSLAAQLCQAPHLAPYHSYLESQPALLSLLSSPQCAAQPARALLSAVLQPLASLPPPPAHCLVLLDGLCEAEQHRPDHGDTVASFLLRHLHHFPPWLRLVLTSRTGALPALRSHSGLHCVSLDTGPEVDQDISDFITSRQLQSQPAFSLVPRAERENLISVFRAHLVRKASGCFLYVKMMMEFLERGQIVIKSDSFKLLPQSLSEMYQLAFNLRFSSGPSYEAVSLLLSVCLASLRPPSLEELHQISGSERSEFLAQYSLISSLLVTRADGSLMVVHPTLRDWLVRRGPGPQHRFLCNTKQGHAAIALHLSRSGPVSSPGRVLELAHHLLKSGLHKTEQASSLSHRDLTALHLALAVPDISLALTCPANLFSPSVRVTRLLLLAGADPGVVTEHSNNSTLLGVYCSLGYTDMVALLIEWGADVNTDNEAGETPLCQAAEAGNTEIFSLLLHCGARLDRPERLVRAAARGGNTELVRQVLDTLQSLDTTGDSVDTGDTEDNGESVDTEDSVDADERRKTSELCLPTVALVTAAAHRHKQLVEELLQLPSVDIRLSVGAEGEGEGEGEGLTALEAAAQAGAGDIVELLLAAEPSLACGRAWFLAAAGGHLTILQIFSSHGVEEDMRDEEGRTALCHAVIASQHRTVRYLVEAGASLDMLDSRERSVVEVAVLQDDLEMLETLLQCGAELTAGLVELAVEGDSPAILSLLLERGAPVEQHIWPLVRGKQQLSVILLNKCLEDGNRLFRRSRLQEASEKYREGVERLPDLLTSPGHHFTELRKSLLLNLSRCERRRGKLSPAIELAGLVIREDDEDSDAFLTRAKAFRAAGMLKEAVEDYSSALCINPTNETVYIEFLKVREELKFSEKSSKKAFHSNSYDSIAYIDDTSTNCSSI